MAVDAEELLIRPFRDVVAAGSAALANAAAHAAHAAHAPRDGPASAEPEDRMTRAAQALVREGERALTKVQSVWNANVDRHGDSFRDAMVQQGKSGRPPRAPARPAPRLILMSHVLCQPPSRNAAWTWRISCGTLTTSPTQTASAWTGTRPCRPPPRRLPSTSSKPRGGCSSALRPCPRSPPAGSPRCRLSPRVPRRAPATAPARRRHGPSAPAPYPSREPRRQPTKSKARTRSFHPVLTRIFHVCRRARGDRRPPCRPGGSPSLAMHPAPRPDTTCPGM